MNGWTGKIAVVDLTSGKISSIEPSAQTYRDCIGGVGLNAHLLYHHLRPGIPPLSEGNILAMMTGPVTGMNFPGVGRVSVCARSPLTNGWGESSMGGHLGQAIKAAGYDGLLVNGISSTPCYVVLAQDGITVQDASSLWGLDTYETEARLKATHGTRAQVASIGQAGENLVSFAAINHGGGDVAGRCGLGAVMGSKRLKAVVAIGSGTAPAFDEEALAELRNRLLAAYEKDWWVGTLKAGGTAWGTGLAVQLNDVPVKNWAIETKEWTAPAQNITGQAMDEAGLVVGRTSCFRCPIACRRLVEVDSNGWSVPRSAGPEYETVGALGAMLMIEDVRALCKANELCNRFGLDTISCGGTIAWAIEAFEQGLLSAADTDGLQLRWGDGRMLVELIERIAHREGIGQLLAGGSRSAAAQLGKGENLAIQVKGLELAMHHPRAMRGLEISYASGARGASHNEGGSVHKDGITIDERAAAIAASVDRAMVNGSAVWCSFTVGPLSNADAAAVLHAATGHAYNEQELMAAGQRIWHLRRVFNLRHCGVAGEADVLPSRVLAQLPETPAFPDLLAAYYRARGLDSEGIARRERLAELGLSAEADDLGLAG